MDCGVPLMHSSLKKQKPQPGVDTHMCASTASEQTGQQLRLRVKPSGSAWLGHVDSFEASGMQMPDDSHQPHLVSPAERVVQSPQLVKAPQYWVQVLPMTMTSMEASAA